MAQHRRWMMRTLFVVVVTLFAFACSDDGEGPTGEKAVTDGPTPTGDSVLPWPDSFQIKDGSAWKCTPGEANMCDGFKTQFCDNGTCTPCPANMVDCDRVGDCECYGACDGDHCVK